MDTLTVNSREEILKHLEKLPVDRLENILRYAMAHCFEESEVAGQRANYHQAILWHGNACTIHSILFAEETHD